LAQPEIDEPDLYWKSIEDFLQFTASVANQRAPVSGQSLLQLFEEAKPSIMQITDFSNPSIPFDQIMQNITDRYLKEASSTAIAGCEEDIKEWLTQLKSESLRRGLNVDFVGEMIVRWMRVFEEKSEQLFPHLLEYSIEQTQKHRELIRNQIETFSNQLFVQRCIVVLLPEIVSEIVERIKREITREVNEIPVANFSCFPFTTLLSRYEQEGESRFKRSVMMIHPDIQKSQEFSKSIGQMRTQISIHVKDIETAKRQQYAEYIQQQIEQEKAAREAQYQENLRQMKLQEAEKLRKSQEERDTAERRRREEETRAVTESQQNQMLRAQEQRQKNEYEAEKRAIQERLNRERDQVIKTMTDQRREIESRSKARIEQEQRDHDKKAADLQKRLEQLDPRLRKTAGNSSRQAGRRK
jgi:chemotaxis protein histidine kinase CheA